MHFLCELVDRCKESRADSEELWVFGGGRLVLNETMESRDNTGSGMIDPDSQSRSLERFSSK